MRTVTSQLPRADNSDRRQQQSVCAHGLTVAEPSTSSWNKVFRLQSRKKCETQLLIKKLKIIFEFVLYLLQSSIVYPPLYHLPALPCFPLLPLPGYLDLLPGVEDHFPVHLLGPLQLLPLQPAAAGDQQFRPKGKRREELNDHLFEILYGYHVIKSTFAKPMNLQYTHPP